jgi:hypothetical protein
LSGGDYGRPIAPMPPLPRLVKDMPEVRALCGRLVPGTIPDLLVVDAPPWAAPDQCTENVARVVGEQGGEIVYGWKLVELLPGLMIEAEFHAVVISPQGDMLDVTPSGFPATHTVFLPDPSLSYEGRQINSVRVALGDDPLVGDLIEALDDHFRAMNMGELADLHGEIVATPEIRDAKARLEDVLGQIMRKHY